MAIRRQRLAPISMDTSPVMAVSSDTHIGPRLKEDLRPYCPRQYLDAFDEFDQAHRNADNGLRTLHPEKANPQILAVERNAQSPGHYDMHARLRDLDRDGVAGEVFFHGSQNGEPIPFQEHGLFRQRAPESSRDREQAAIGLHMYNQWLADVCTIEPERHVGFIHVPMWDIEASLKEVEWAASVGLKSVNFPAPRPGVVEYNRPEWEPFWSACEALDLPLTTHAGAGIEWLGSGPEMGALASIESGGWMSRRAVHWMIFGGVSHRHRGLRIVLTEQPGDWWTSYLNELDAVYLAAQSREMRKVVPELPSDACKRAVFIGMSFLAPFEAEHAQRDGFVEHILWGSDYPHLEGTWTMRPSVVTLRRRRSPRANPPRSTASFLFRSKTVVMWLPTGPPRIVSPHLHPVRRDRSWRKPNAGALHNRLPSLYVNVKGVSIELVARGVRGVSSGGEGDGFEVGRRVWCLCRRRGTD
jgi:predicted TIM-barrel fold metal-dependent hydrolase